MFKSANTRLASAACLLLLGAAAMADAASLPSYKQALEAFQAERAAGNGPKVSPEDRAVMDQAGADLAAAMPRPGLAVGDQAPGFDLTDARGETVTLEDLLSKGPVVLTFYRGAWCPYCNLQLRGLSQSLPAITAAGGQLVAVTPQTPDKSLEQVSKDGFPFPILSDLDSSVMRAYGLYFEVPDAVSDVYKRNFALDLAAYNGAGRSVLPVPATYVIDRDGVVRFAFADTDYRKRVEPEAIVAALKAL
ncbi:MAG: peroxiredoxin-like family protein [Thiohalocapsa sp.]